MVDADLLGPSIHYTLQLDVPPEALEVLEVLEGYALVLLPAR